MKELELKDVLHLYMGCSFKEKNSDKRVLFELCGWNIYDDCVQNRNGHRYFSIDNIQLVLRRLEDMTEEQGFCIFGSKDKYLLYRKEREENAADLFLFSPNEIRRLYEEAFDLYRLIPRGLAIDQKTL